MEVAAAGVARVSINEALRRAPPAIAAHLSGFGTAAMRFTWPWSSAIDGTLQSLDVKRSLIYTSNFRSSLRSQINGLAAMAAGKVKLIGASVMATDMSPRMNTIEGLWWKRDVQEDDWFAVTNRSQRKIPVTIEVLAAMSKQEATGKRIVLLAHQTQWVKLNEALDYTNGRTRQGGIRIQYEGVPHSVDVTGGMENAAEGYSAAIPFTHVPMADEKPSSWSIASVGIMEGRPDPMLNFPAGTTFSSYAVLRNISSQSMQVMPTLYLTPGRQGVRGIEKSDLEIAAPALILEPGEIRSLDLEQVLSGHGFQGGNGSLTLCLKVGGVVGGLLAAIGSVDQTGNYVFEVDPHPVRTSPGKHIQRFDLLNGNDSMVGLWNHGDQEEDLLATFFFQDGHYKLPVHLAPKQSVMFSVLEIARARTPDAEGSVFPRFVTQGTLRISGPRSDIEKINVSISAATFNVQNGTCEVVPTYCEGFIPRSFRIENGSGSPSSDPFSFTLVRGGASQQVLWRGQWTTGDWYIIWPNSYTVGAPSMATVAVGDASTTTNQYDVIRGTSAGQTTLAADDFQPLNTNTCLCNGPDCPDGEFTDEAPLTVYDPTPVITQVIPNSWGAGTTTQVRIIGTGFGTNPTLSITDPSGAVSFVPIPISDTEIDASVTIAGPALGENASIAVTSNGYNGTGFISNQGNSARSPAVNASVVQTFGGFAITVLTDPGTPISGIQLGGEQNAVQAGVASNVRFTAITPAGSPLTSYRGAVHFSSTDSHATLPSDYTFTDSDQGSHVFPLTLASVQGTSKSRDLTVTDGFAKMFGNPGGTTTSNINVWFQVTASREGLVGQTTAYGHIIIPNDHFIALPSKGMANIPLKLFRPTGQTSASTTVLDVGPWCPNTPVPGGVNQCTCGSDPYWNNSGVPFAASNRCAPDSAGIDLADGTFFDMGFAGNGSILWRFDH